jgi:glycosyltransferase involved in cell wall biosynthesis
MKLACVSTSSVPSGSANSIQVMKVCQSLAQVGAEVRLWLPDPVGAHLRVRPEPSGVPQGLTRRSTPTDTRTTWEALAEQYGLETPFEVTWLPTHPRLKRYDFAWQALRAARAWGAGGVYTWLPQTALLALWSKLPVLLELHDRPTGQVGPWLFRQIVRHPGPKRLLFITQALQQVLEREQGVQVRPGEALIAPDGVDLERYTALPSAAEARRQLGLKDGLTAGYTGHLYPGRGMDVLVALAQAYPQINFLWVGGRPNDVTLWRTRTTEMGLSNITLTGFVPNRHIPLYQAAGDILLMPYERSVTVSGGGNTADVCSPMKMFEYMAAGRAILSSDLAVLHEVLDETSAVFCPPEDPALWVNALGRLLSDDPLRTRLGETARRKVVEYAWQERARKCLHSLFSR